MQAQLTNLNDKENKDQLLYIVSEDGCISYISPAGANHFNLTVDQIVGEKEALLFDTQITFDLMEINQRVLITGRPHQYQIKQSQDGHSTTLSVTKHRLPVSQTESSKLICILQVAETPPPQLQAKQVALDQQFWALQTASTAISNSLDVEHISKTFVWEMVHLLQSSACAYYIWQKTQNQFLLQTKYDKTEAIIFADLLPIDTYTFLRHLIEEAIPLQFNNQDATLSHAKEQFLAQMNCSGVLIVPLDIHGNISGIALVCDEEARIYADSETAVARLFADTNATHVLNAQLYSELLQTNERLTESNSDLQAFARTTAHDLKTPVGSIIGFAELLMQQHADFSQEEIKEFLGIILRSSRQMHAIIDNLLLLASVRQQDIPSIPVDMGTILPEVLTRLAYLIKQNNCEIIVQKEWPIGFGNAHWLEEVWANYISNAIKYGGKPPVVELGASNLNNGMTRYWVKDNGRGLSPAEQEKLFIPFSRLHQKGSAQGHGLGLSIVQRIIQKLNGSTGVESSPGEGSLFYFTLPTNIFDEESL